MSRKIQSAKQALLKAVWDQPLDNLPAVHRAGLLVLRIFYLVGRDLYQGQLTLRAMGLVYTTLLALIPLLAVGFSVLRGMGVHQKMEPMLLNFLAPMGERGEEIASRIMGFVENIQAGVLGTIGSMLLFYTVISLLKKIEEAFNACWQVEENRPFSLRVFYYVGIVVLGPVLIITAVTLAASADNIWLTEKISNIKFLGFIFSSLGMVLPYALVVIAFTLIYKLIPNTDVKITSALIGGLVGGLAWQATGWGFALFVVNSAKYAAIYSAFATLILFMIWLYISWVILLTGAMIAFYSQYPYSPLEHNQPLCLSERYRLGLTLSIMFLIGENFYRQEPCWTNKSLAKKLNCPENICQILISGLESKGFLTRTHHLEPCFLPAYSIGAMRIPDIITASRSIGESRQLESEDINRILDKIDAQINSAYDNLTLLDLYNKEQTFSSPVLPS